MKKVKVSLSEVELDVVFKHLTTAQNTIMDDIGIELGNDYKELHEQSNLLTLMKETTASMSQLVEKKMELFKDVKD